MVIFPLYKRLNVILFPPPPPKLLGRRREKKYWRLIAPYTLTVCKPFFKNLRRWNEKNFRPARGRMGPFLRVKKEGDKLEMGSRSTSYKHLSSGTFGRGQKKRVFGGGGGGGPQKTQFFTPPGGPPKNPNSSPHPGPPRTPQKTRIPGPRRGPRKSHFFDPPRGTPKKAMGTHFFSKF